MWKKNGFIYLLALVIGFSIGLFVFGWGFFPVNWQDVSVNDLRTDMKIDYLKLVADSYAYRPDKDLALQRASFLELPQGILEQALASSTATEKNHLLALQTLLPVMPAVKAVVEPGGGILAYAGYGFLAILLLAMILFSARRWQWKTIQHLWRSETIRKRIGMAVLLVGIYRLTSNIPLTGINQESAKRALEMTGDVHQGIGGLILSMDVLAGGTLSTFSILSIGVYAFVIAQLVIRLCFVLVPALQRRFEDDPRAEREAMERWTPRVSLLLSIPLSFLLVNLYSGTFAACMGQMANPPAIQSGAVNLLGTITMVFEIIAAAKFAEWLTGLLSEVFSGMGSAIIIASGIALELVRSLNRAVSAPGTSLWGVVVFILVVIALILVVIYMQMGRRNIAVMYPGRRVGFRASQPLKSDLPLMAGMAGIFPVLTVQGLLTLPIFVTVPLLCSGNPSLQAFAAGLGDFLSTANPGYWLVFLLLLIPFTFFYTNVYFSSQNYGENLKRLGAQLPGVNRGQSTEKYLERVVRRITIPYAVMLVVVVILPVLLIRFLNLDISPLLGISIFIFVQTARDIITILDTQIKLAGYQDSFLSR